MELASGKSFRVREEVFLTGRVDPTKLKTYDKLFNDMKDWPGVDFSLVEERERVLEAVKAYQRTLGNSTKESLEVQAWLKLQGFVGG